MHATVRLATLHDAQALRDLGEQTFVATYAAFNTPENMALYLAEKFTLPQILAELTEPNTVFWVVELSARMVAYAKLIQSPRPPQLATRKAVEIERLYADATHHGQGLGALLMQTSLEWAKQQAYDTVWLGVWEQNPKAIRFYEKMGFEHFGEHTFWLGQDPQRDLLLQKSV